MIPRIQKVTPLNNFRLNVSFDDGRTVVYDVMDDINHIDDFKDLLVIYGLFGAVQLDESRTCVFWNDKIDLASDTIYEYGEPITIALTKDVGLKVTSGKN